MRVWDIHNIVPLEISVPWGYASLKFLQGTLLILRGLITTVNHSLLIINQGETMFSKLDDLLNGVGISLSTQCIPYTPKDKEGVVTSVTVFIPWHLAGLTSVADVNKALPNGWNASASSRTEDMQEAMSQGVNYTPSIAIQQGQDCLQLLNEAVSKKA
tara:strand:- start:23 stop:496 length:474 start_codon:yes stop_codon:yes gene_type:complete